MGGSDSEMFSFEEALEQAEEELRRLREAQDQTSSSEASISTNRNAGQRSSSSVCRHWLRGMCWKGDTCDFLHQYDTARMPVCRAYARTGSCPDGAACLFQHSDPVGSSSSGIQSEQGSGATFNSLSNLGDPATIQSRFGGVIDATAPVCIHYLLGYCRSGPRCKRRHESLPPSDLPPLVPDWYLHLILNNARTVIPDGADPETDLIMEQVESRCRDAAAKHHRVETGGTTPFVAPDSVSTPRAMADSAAKNKPSFTDGAIGSVNQASPARSGGVSSETREKARLNGIPALGLSIDQQRPGPLGTFPPVRCFIVKYGDARNLLKSVRLGVWATGRLNTRTFEQAFTSSSGGVVLLFSGNESGGFQGYARIRSLPISTNFATGLWGQFNNKLGPTFRIQWLKQCCLDFERFGGITNPLNQDQPIRKSRDGQEVPFELAALICTVLYEQPEVDHVKGDDNESSLPRIDHESFFRLTPAEQFAEDSRVGLRPPGSVYTPSSSVDVHGTGPFSAVAARHQQPQAVGLPRFQPLPPPPPPRITDTQEAVAVAVELMSTATLAEKFLQQRRR